MFDQFIKSGREALRKIKDYRRVAIEVKKIVKAKYPKAKVLVFGSAVEGDFTASSDIDILVVQDGISNDYDLKARILVEVDAPIELHFVSEKEFNEWYLRFIKRIEDV